MDIKSALQKEHSKSLTLKVAKYVGSNHQRFKTLMDLFFDEDNRLSQRASWAVSNVVIAQPNLITPYLRRMLAQLDRPVHNAIKRNTMRILAEIDWPEDLTGEIADISFRFLDDPKEAIAIRVFSMTVCYKITLKEPELANELKIILEDHLPHATAGFKSRANKILKALPGLKNS